MVLVRKVWRHGFMFGWMITFFHDMKWATGDPAFILARILQTVACRGISPPLFFSPLPFTLAPSVLCPHSSVVWWYIDNTPLFFFLVFLLCTGLYHRYFNVTPRKPLNKMELPHKLRWDQFLILATALMSPVLTWVHLRADVRRGLWQQGIRQGLRDVTE